MVLSLPPPNIMERGGDLEKWIDSAEMHNREELREDPTERWVELKDFIF